MPLEEVPNFLAKLESYDGDPQTRLALWLMVLTFARTAELRAARWSELEALEGSEPVWRVPAERMKNEAGAHRATRTAIGRHP